MPSECKYNFSADEFVHNEYTDLRLAFPDGYSNNNIIDHLKHRFDELPIHKICYYQSYNDNETSIKKLKRKINPWKLKIRGQLNVTGKQQDCLGMTPLHILACSTKQRIKMYRLLIDKYPETLVMKDKWGDIPLLYAIWCNAPAEVIDLLVESYKSLHPNYEFDWSGMLLTLAKRRVPLVILQNLINTQENCFPGQDYDMQKVVLELADLETISQAKCKYLCTSDETFSYLLHASISKRLDSLAVGRWCEELKNSIDVLPEKAGKKVMHHKAVYRERYAITLYERLATYESIKEGTSVLELVLLKAKIEARRQEARGDRNAGHDQCRFNSGANIVIPNVLSYLLPSEDTISGDAK